MIILQIVNQSFKQKLIKHTSMNKIIIKKKKKKTKKKLASKIQILFYLGIIII